MVRIVASCGRRRRRLAEEVPGLYIRRLTLEDPKSAKESSAGSRSRTPPPPQPSSSSSRHICHPPAPYVSSFSSSTSSYIRGVSSSYRSWQERIRKERPAYLTIVSLELPESPIPLIESQASARFRSNEFDRNRDKDDILDELLEKVSEASKEREKESSRGSGNLDVSRERRTRKRQLGSMECTKEVATLEECTRNILETHQIGEKKEVEGSERSVFRDVDDCICSEIPENLRINVRKKTEVTSASSSANSTPEVTHTIRIAMKYHGRPGRCKIRGEENGRDEKMGKKRSKGRNAKDIEETTTNSGGGKGEEEEVIREDGCCTDVNVALDFTLNCSSVRLTSRDINLKAGTKRER